MKTVAVCILLVLCSAALANAVDSQSEMDAEFREQLKAELMQQHGVKQSSRANILVDPQFTSAARLVFRGLDADRDMKLSMQEGSKDLRQYLPGLSDSEYASFIELADKNGDKALDKDEFMNALAQGLQLAQTSGDTDAVAATDATTQKTGLIGGVLSAGFSALTGGVNKFHDGCVLCQYIVERAETNVKASGVVPALSGAGMGPYASFLEVSSEQNPYETAAAGIIGATRQSTRYQRQLERQKYNEIYRVVDITLDDVCEQGMPDDFYKHCKKVYQKQGDVVDGLRYQYRPSDICYKVGICGRTSYITKGIHSRYRNGLLTGMMKKMSI